MKTSDHIVHGGGWVQRKSVGRPKARLFGILALVWLGVCVAVSAPFWLDSWPPTFSGAEWLSLLLMLPEPVFLVLAIRFALTEQPRSITEHVPNPDHDLRKLY